MLENWKATAATLFNPYVNLNSLSSSHSRQQSVKTRVVTPTRHSRAPPESVVANSNSKSKTPDEPRRVLSKQLPSPDAAEDVTIYVQQMIHSQFCGRSGTPSDMRYEQQQQQNKARRTKSTPTNNRLASQLTLSSDPHPSRGSSPSHLPRSSSIDHESTRSAGLVSDYQLDHFFDRADEQMSRMALLMPGRESTFSDYVSPSRQRFVLPLSPSLCSLVVTGERSSFDAFRRRFSVVKVAGRMANGSPWRTCAMLPPM